MSPEVLDLWSRSLRALVTAEELASGDPDGSASRAYYAAFHAVCALFALEGKHFTRHSAVEAAVHRDLVKPGRLTTEQGTTYSWLARLRTTGDYGGQLHVSTAEAQEAVRRLRGFVQAVATVSPEPLPAIPPAA